MKQIIYLTLSLIAIPFFVVIFLLKTEESSTKIIANKEAQNELFVRVEREAAGTIEKINLEDYVVGVLAGEMPISFEIEALKAQAVAARSYVLTRIEVNKDNTFDVVDGTNNQVYLDNEYLKSAWKDKYDENITKLYKAVSETHLQYIAYDGKVADALFFSTSNGYTENSEEAFSTKLPYLRSVQSTWDETTSPVFNDQKEYSKEQFFSLLGLPDSSNLNIDIIEKSSTGRTLDLKINGAEMKGTDVEKKLKLRSNDFQIINAGDNITIKTVGYGHGVGMSQYGALGMAKAGYTYDQILKYYYKGVSINAISY